MTVSELIAELNKYDPNLMVVVDGYEGGVEELLAVGSAYIMRNEGTDSSLFGTHRLIEWGIDEGVEPIDAVYLPRRD